MVMSYVLVIMSSMPALQKKNEMYAIQCMRYNTNQFT